MKHLISIAALTAAFSFAPQAMASEGGSCHFHGHTPAKETTITTCANQHKESLVKRGKLDKTWLTAPLDKAEQVEGSKGKEWKLSYKNPAVTDKSKETLYLFYTLPGNFIAANFTGR